MNGSYLNMKFSLTIIITFKVHERGFGTYIHEVKSRLLVDGYKLLDLIFQ